MQILFVTIVGSRNPNILGLATIKQPTMQPIKQQPDRQIEVIKCSPLFKMLSVYF